MIDLSVDDEAVILSAIRRVPEPLADAAWKYVGDRIRAVREPTVFDIREIAEETIWRYGRRWDEPADAEIKVRRRSRRSCRGSGSTKQEKAA